MAITSQVHASPIFGEVTVMHWQLARLLKRSVIKPLLTTIERSLVLRQLGTLHDDDQVSLRQVLAAVLG